MGYMMRLPTFDNSTVETRQVRRQRERLALKGRSDIEPTLLREPRYSSSKYLPHEGGGQKRPKP